mmetsp:Transcript_12214/g.26000  ORF Transcript_12214/g.26000 Transcript_12214/m.26000 type:complete len:120 (+) Transcript_12214:327-686(+)
MTFSIFDSEIDFSFAICPRRRNNLCSPNNVERTSFIQDYGNDNFNFEYDYNDEDEDEEDASSVDSYRSVTFADNVVTEIISVPRYETESKSDLFYNRLDMKRFKQEARLERRYQIQVVW